VPSMSPYDLPFPPKWGSIYANCHVSATGDLMYTSSLVLG